MLQTVLRYAAPLAILAAVALAFLKLGRPMPLRGRARYWVAGLAGLPLVASGTLHLLAPSTFLPLLPPWVAERQLVIMLTGLPELAGAIGLFLPRTRRAAAAWLVVMMIAIFPANIYVAGERVGPLLMPQVPARLALQAAYIVLLLVAGYGWPRRLLRQSH
jgi:uncharacterized membrane protein